MLMSMVPFIFIFAVMYFLIMRPQGKKQKDHQKFLTGIETRRRRRDGLGNSGPHRRLDRTIRDFRNFRRRAHQNAA